MIDQTNSTNDELGDLLAEYGGQGIASLVGKLIVGAVFGLGGLGLIGWAVFSAIRDLGNLERDGAFLVFFVPGILCFMGVAILPIGAWMLMSVRNSLGLKVRVYAEGFAITRRGKTDLLRWDGISEVTIAPYVFGSARTGQTRYLSYHVQRRDGLKVVLDQANMPDAPTVGKRIVEEASERLFSEMLEAFDRGGQLAFGEGKSRLIVCKQGIQYKSKTLIWEEVAGVALDLKGNWLTIEQRGAPGKKGKRWARVFLSTVPNAPVLVRLIEQGKSQP
jgi:hypothetical protein